MTRIIIFASFQILDIQYDQYDQDNIDFQLTNPIQSLFQYDTIKINDKPKNIETINFIKIKDSDILFVNLNYATDPQTKKELIGYKQLPSIFQPSIQQTLELSIDQFKQLIQQDSEQYYNTEKETNKNKKETDNLEYESSDESTKQNKKNNKHKQQTEIKFHWSYELRVIFTMLILLFNINNVKPKQIIKYFPQKYHINTCVISSHLQKYKLKILKDYKLTNTKDIQPYMYPQECNSEEIQEISNQLKINPEKIFTEQEIQQYLKKYQV